MSRQILGNKATHENDGTHGTKGRRAGLCDPRAPGQNSLGYLARNRERPPKPSPCAGWSKIVDTHKRKSLALLSYASWIIFYFI